MVESTVGGADRVPIWFMRQAGRSLPEYMRAREGTTMLESCLMPDLAAEITMQPVRRYGVDAAIFFSDIVVPLYAAGVGVDIKPGIGPVMDAPIRSLEAVRALPVLEAEQIEPVAKAVSKVRAELDDSVSLIGFAGAPFTLASYLVEGGPSRNHEHTKALMYSEPEVWDQLMTSLANMTTHVLKTQIAAGADAIQLFDSWVGALDRADFERFVAPYSRQVLATLEIAAVPRTYFGVGTGELLSSISQLGVSTVGVDWRVPLDVAHTRVEGGKVLQGNLDPALLLADPEVLTSKVTEILDAGQRAINAGATGHVFNLGHGVLPDTNPDALARVVDTVHAFRAGRAY
ncbi:MAG TPA: uroporphyrinogen decarboxylase [Dietzia timorensis]|uniref:Uroporphyrinogen decarboxylase n=1 Tax=Dietzia timorensis TaxID=499555 RepID=A0A921F5Z3_9ACTN|nr:uroporphyrinogen decarboxylase [Dietzia timorensis]HJE91513.1 uroporphyrinogen decarboxylase [Dietzia timorensis]